MKIGPDCLKSRPEDREDEFYTPAYAVRPIVKHIPAKATVWCPFDTEDSEYVKILRAEGFNVIATHIWNGQDFFEYEPSEPYDIIISNPPYRAKDAILKRLKELDKPYAMLLPLATLQGQKRFPYINDCEALIFDKRIQFYKDSYEKIWGNAYFGTFYLCRKLLPEKLIFEELKVDKK